MDTKTKTNFYFLLRFFRDGKPDIYAAAYRNGQKRMWHMSESRKASPATKYRQTERAKNARDDAYLFQSRNDARSAIKSPAFYVLVLGKRYEYGRDAGKRDEKTRYFWEIIKVTETIVTSYEEEIEVSDAPDMLVLARAASL